MTSQIPKIVEKYNFKISAFCDIIHPFVLPTRVCVVNCNKLFETAFYSLSVKKTLPIVFNTTKSPTVPLQGIVFFVVADAYAGFSRYLSVNRNR